MSEQINKVLASTSQAFTDAEKEIARNNIGAMPASASLQVTHDSTLSGSGTSGSPLGLNSSVTLSSTNPYFGLADSTGSAAMYRSSIDLWNSYSSITGSTFTGCSANNCITGDGTSGSPLGISSVVKVESGGSAASLSRRGVTVEVSGLRTAWYYAAFASFEKDTATANLYADCATFANASGTERVDASSIYRWNHPTYYCIIKTPGANTTQHVTTASYPTGLTANTRVDILNLGPTAAGYNYVVYERNSNGATRTLSAGQSGTVWWDAAASAWTTLGTANE